MSILKKSVPRMIVANDPYPARMGKALKSSLAERSWKRSLRVIMYHSICLRLIAEMDVWYHKMCGSFFWWQQ
jgi:hypothetical protein